MLRAEVLETMLYGCVPARVPLRHAAPSPPQVLDSLHRLAKCVMFGEMVGGAGCVGVQEKEWMGCFLDDLRAFGINADQWTIAARDEW